MFYPDDVVVTVSFRDGNRDIPRYLADMMAAIDTIQLTYEQAVDAANKLQLSNYLGTAQRRLTAVHFSGGRVRDE